MVRRSIIALTAVAVLAVPLDILSRRKPLGGYFTGYEFFLCNGDMRLLIKDWAPLGPAPGAVAPPPPTPAWAVRSTWFSGAPWSAPAAKRVAFAGVLVEQCGTSLLVVVPLSFPVAILAAWVFLLLGVGVLRRQRRRWKGLCINCGYNLTGNVTGVCPECSAPTRHGAPPQGSIQQKGRAWPTPFTLH